MKKTATQNQSITRLYRHRAFRWFTALVIFFYTLSAAAFAQDKTVKGRVTSDNGSPVSGASVQVRGTTRGASTNNNGEFSITAAKGAVLIITSIGYADKEITVGDASQLSIQLAAFSKDIGEVVVVGYGTQRKKDLTGSVASVNLEAMHDAPNTNIGQYLQGTVAGLNVGLSTYAGGTPPISIRGRVSLNGNQNVLIILDGIQYTGSLSSINPDDIASIDVLKDASSTAVYGAQAANGVILITSRKGRSGSKPRVALSSSYTTQTPTIGKLRPLNRQEYLDKLKEDFYDKAYTGPDYLTPVSNFNIAQWVDGSMRDGSGNLLPNDFNWWDAGTNKGSIFETNLSISGGSDRFNYFLAGSLVDQKGYIINDIFKRKTVRANLETKPLSWWKVGIQSSAAFVNQDGAEPSLATLQHMSPLLKPFDSAGKLIPFPTNTIEASPFTTYYVDNRDRNNYYFANIYSDIDFPFLKGLNYRMNFGQNYRETAQFGASIYAAGQTGEAYKNYQEYYDYTFDNILSYTKKFGDHEIGATILYGSVERKFNSTNSRATGFSRLNLSYNNLSQGTNQFASSDAWTEALNYQMARVNYKFSGKYLLTATIRRDGFSGFARNFKYAYFPTAAVGWVISDEKFMQKIKSLNFLKLRAGYGEIGNQTTRYSSIARVTSATSNAYIFGDGGTTNVGQQVASLGNDDLRWERTKGLNVGVDFTMFNNSFSGTLDFYRNNTYDLLFSVNIPQMTGFNSITTNLGQIRNTGFEATFSQKIINKKDFTWTANLFFAANVNKILTLTGQDLNKDGKEDDLIASGLFIGKSVNAIYTYQTNGIYQLKDTRLPGFPVGSMRVVDQNKDGDITAEGDRVFLGRQEPAYRWSLQNSFSYKGFGFSFFLNSVQGGSDGFLGDVRPFANNRPQYYREDNTIRWNDLKGIDYWSPRNPNGKYPRNISGSPAKIEPGMWESRSFVRLQDVSLSYNFAFGLLKKINAQSMSLYASGKNLFTWTKWDGWDPEAVDDNGNASGLIIGGRPVLRSFTVGINITY